ncbi:MAG: class I SAM-dependent methyltransferase [Spirulina sp. SIO3F2]|nr:class I SAM-dependent methyltransferase [Spirulina sp. SIO3F2]
MVDLLAKLAYQTLQQGKGAFGVANKQLTTNLLNFFNPARPRPKTEPLSPQSLVLLQQRFAQLMELDWLDAEAGIYPTDLLFDSPWGDFLRYYPDFLLDLPNSWARSQNKQYQDFAPNLKTEGYPRYYLQNFHHQTDGYLSEQSANLYDLQVELLFNGAADPMRRRVLPPLKAHLTQATQPTRILDVACGTGRTLRMIRGMLSEAALFGIDLSAAYLRKANQLLSELPGELPQLVQANAEEIPYVAHYFDAITSVFLFHELPAGVRQTVIEECCRVLKPGGIFIICDSIQEGDTPEFSANLKNFPVLFHEPYYRHYITDDIEGHLTQAGFGEIEIQIHFMSKYWIAKKS